MAPVVPLQPPFLLLLVIAPQFALGETRLSLSHVRKELNNTAHLSPSASKGTTYHPQPANELNPPG